LGFLSDDNWFLLFRTRVSISGTTFIASAYTRIGYANSTGLWFTNPASVANFSQITATAPALTTDYYARRDSPDVAFCVVISLNGQQYSAWTPGCTATFGFVKNTNFC
jgi:hypothetical protein